jgi:hypothetical protein
MRSKFTGRTIRSGKEYGGGTVGSGARLWQKRKGGLREDFVEKALWARERVGVVHGGDCVMTGGEFRKQEVPGRRSRDDPI